MTPKSLIKYGSLTALITLLNYVNMLSMKSRNEVIFDTVIKTNYHKLDKLGKSKVLDLLVDSVNLDRKRIIKKIKNSNQEKEPKRRIKKYGVLVKKALEKL
jgi:hypothetical protein